ncbi:stomatin-like protein 2, mitochondrial [Mizuhopecten yessoensis]|uniref:Stomatin-like protein 2, mitochondrial n=1 Tax=Mizuhopecten yessoensis TaxID=6573 RepID=A0A210QZB6_MIZYE|nr:stomatin-like protein 2, mitochondrial [Mizuhopecten yessoensis]OWF54067.1 Stomatin-like protein 2, mitochondrial [Mizuhopecten yessoensis]
MHRIPNSGLVRLLSRDVYHQSKRLLAARTNMVITFVPQQEAWIVERFGKFSKTMKPGLNILVPIIDTIKYVQILKEIPIEVPHQSAITLDNVLLNLDGVLYVKVLDPYKASYGVEDVEFAVTQLAQTTMRSEIGKISLDEIFRERESLNVAIVSALNKAAEDWGITCLRYEIRDIKLPHKIQEAMQMMVEAERKKRAFILESEGKKQSEINVAEGHKQAKILASEGYKIEQINTAQGEAEALKAKANAKAEAIRAVANALGKKNGSEAVSYNVAEQYVTAFGNLAKTSNTIILPANTGDVSSMVAQAMSIYKNLSTERPTTDYSVDSESTEPTLSGSTEPTLSDFTEPTAPTHDETDSDIKTDDRKDP